MVSLSVNEADHFQGRPQAPVILIEYGDFESIRCGLAYYEIEKLQVEFGEEICFVFRHFPDRTVHSHALTAALAAEAAAEQNRFWEMYHMLFQNQDELDRAALEFYAEVLGLDMEPFAEGLQRQDLLRKVLQDQAAGRELGVSVTPTLFLNGLKLDRLPNYENLSRVVQTILYGHREPVVNS